MIYNIITVLGFFILDLISTPDLIGPGLSVK